MMRLDEPRRILAIGLATPVLVDFLWQLAPTLTAARVTFCFGMLAVCWLLRPNIELRAMCEIAAAFAIWAALFLDSAMLYRAFAGILQACMVACWWQAWMCTEARKARKLAFAAAVVTTTALIVLYIPFNFILIDPLTGSAVEWSDGYGSVVARVIGNPLFIMLFPLWLIGWLGTLWFRNGGQDVWKRG